MSTLPPDIPPRDCERDRLPARLRTLFSPLPPDPHVDAFARGEKSAPHGPIRGALHALLRRTMSDFEADGLLSTHPMALLGERSWQALLGPERMGRLLDIGAGAGHVTEHARSLFDEIVTTETSRAMAWRLRSRGFVCHVADVSREPLAEDRPFDVVSLLNVLDRCERPRSMLAAALRLLGPGGRLLSSVPLPVRPHVDVGSFTVDPDEPLSGRGERWEDAVVDFVRGTLEPAGAVVERISRAPYLSRGSRARPLYVLDAALVVCRAARAR